MPALVCVYAWIVQAIFSSKWCAHLKDRPCSSSTAVDFRSLIRLFHLLFFSPTTVRFDFWLFFLGRWPSFLFAFGIWSTPAFFFLSPNTFKEFRQDIGTFLVRLSLSLFLSFEKLICFESQCCGGISASRVQFTNGRVFRTSGNCSNCASAFYVHPNCDSAFFFFFIRCLPHTHTHTRIPNHRLSASCGLWPVHVSYAEHWPVRSLFLSFVGTSAPYLASAALFFMLTRTRDLNTHTHHSPHIMRLPNVIHTFESLFFNNLLINLWSLADRSSSLFISASFFVLIIEYKKANSNQ